MRAAPKTAEASENSAQHKKKQGTGNAEQEFVCLVSSWVACFFFSSHLPAGWCLDLGAERRQLELKWVGRGNLKYCVGQPVDRPRSCLLLRGSVTPLMSESKGHHMNTIPRSVRRCPIVQSRPSGPINAKARPGRPGTRGRQAFSGKPPFPTDPIPNHQVFIWGFGCGSKSDQ